MLKRHFQCTSTCAVTSASAPESAASSCNCVEGLYTFAKDSRQIGPWTVGPQACLVYCMNFTLGRITHIPWSQLQGESWES